VRENPGGVGIRGKRGIVTSMKENTQAKEKEIYLCKEKSPEKRRTMKDQIGNKGSDTSSKREE